MGAFTNPLSVSEELNHFRDGKDPNADATASVFEGERIVFCFFCKGNSVYNILYNKFDPHYNLWHFPPTFLQHFPSVSNRYKTSCIAQNINLQQVAQTVQLLKDSTLYMQTQEGLPFLQSFKSEEERT